MIVGTVVGTKVRPNTPNEFHFWIPTEERSICIGSIIKVEDGTTKVFGMVESMECYSEVEDMLVHQLSRGGDPHVKTPNKEQSVIVCKARVIKQHTDRPLREGIVCYPTREELEEILNVEGCTIPFGIFKNTDGMRVPVKVDENYLLGFEGAHVNISGMSGLGTKTSSFLFILSSIFAHSNSKVACIMFNIKSDDLLYVDEFSPSLEKEDLEIYRLCGIEPSGFNARFFAPSSPVAKGKSLKKNTEIFRWGYKEIKEFIPSLLKAGDQDQKEKIDTAFYDLQKMASKKGLNSFYEILKFMKKELLPEDKGWTDLIRGTYKATWGKLFNQIKGLESKYGGLITFYEDEVIDLPYDELKPKEVWVIDIQQLGFYPRKLVFEKVISEFVKRLEFKTLNVEKIILFMDELNKYAPALSSQDIASLKAKLIDVSARGRSIGLSLFGAEQFRSKVDHNILGNVSTDIYGKTKQAELLEPIYKKFSEEIKEKMRRFKKGEKLVDHELFDAPIFVQMPRPPCMLGSDKAKILNIAQVY
jgi:hypothetical protein